MEKIKIVDLESITSVIDRLKGGEELSVSDLDFTKIKPLQVKIAGDKRKYNGTMPSSLCYGLCEFQNELFKVYAQIKYNSNTLRYLTNADKKSLELVFEINEGCTDIWAQLADFVKACGDALHKVTQGMSGTQKTWMILLLILAVFGGVIIKAEIDSSKEQGIKQLELSEKESEENSHLKQMEILKDGMLSAMEAMKSTESKAIANGVIDHSTKAYEGVMKPLTDASSIQINGASGSIKMSKNDVNNFVSRTIEKPNHEEKTIEVDIDSIKKSQDKLTLSCHEVGKENTFTVYVDLSFIEQDEISLIFDSFKNSSIVKINGNFKTRGGVIEQGNASSITAE